MPLPKTKTWRKETAAVGIADLYADLDPIDASVIWRRPDSHRAIWIENCRLHWLAGEPRANVYLLERKWGGAALADWDGCLIAGEMACIEPWHEGFHRWVFRHRCCDSHWPGTIPEDIVARMRAQER